MKTTDLVDHAAAAAGLDRLVARIAVEAALGGIVAAARRGDEISLAGFGKFKVKDVPARQGRNPATGEAIAIAASRKLGFSPAKQVKEALAG